MPPRVRARELWRIDPRCLEEAQDARRWSRSATRSAPAWTSITDGEMRRESYSNRFATALDGVDVDNPGTTLGPQRQPDARCRASSGPLRRARADPGARRRVPAREHRPHDQGHRPGPVHDGPAGAERALRARARTSRSRSPTSCARRSTTCSRPAPTSCSSTSRGWRRAPTPARELRHRDAPARARRRAAARPRCTSASATRCSCPATRRGYRFLAELADAPVDQISIETAQSELDLAVLAAARRQDDHPRRDRARHARRSRRPRPSRSGIRRALPHKPAEQLVAAPDCGMKYLPRESAFGKLQSLVGGREDASSDQSSREASAAPSASAASFAQTTSGSTAAWPTQVP